MAALLPDETTTGGDVTGGDVGGETRGDETTGTGRDVVVVVVGGTVVVVVGGTELGIGGEGFQDAAS